MVGLSKAQFSILPAGQASPFTFPERPGACGLAQLDDAAGAARALARVTGGQDGQTVPLDVRQLCQFADTAMMSRGGDSVVAERLPGGGSAVHQLSGVPPDAISSVVGAGGGVVLRAVERALSSVNRLVAKQMVGHPVRCSAALVLGSVPAPEAITRATSIRLFSTDEGTVVEPVGDEPVECEVGTWTTTSWPARIHAGPGAVTLVLSVLSFDDAEYRQALLWRAACHPMLRIDMPATLDDPVEVYGRDEPVDLVELVNAEVAVVTSQCTATDLEWWWHLQTFIPPVPLTERIITPREVRGRFPGGVGIADYGPDHATIVAGGHAFNVSGDVLALLPGLLSGEVWAAESPLHEAVAQVFLAAGLAEPAIGA